jgi:hypothetical protein
VGQSFIVHRSEGHNSTGATFLSQITPGVSSAAVNTDRPDRAASRWLQPISRGIALFFALVFLLNVLGELRINYYRPDWWWIPFDFVRAFVEEMASLGVSVLLMAYAFSPPSSWGRIRATRVAIELLSVFIALNILNFYTELIHGRIHSAFPIPFSLLAGVGLWSVWWGVGLPMASRSAAQWVIIAITVLLAAMLVPVLQMFCIGLTEYQHKADVAVVFSAPLLPNGQPSPAMKARVARAVQLFKEGRVVKLYLPGAAGVGQLDEAHVMRNLAIAGGVPVEEIFVQAQSDKPEDIVRDVTVYFPKPVKVIAVSEFEQLPRIWMLFSQDEGWQAAVDTAHAGPAVEGTFQAVCGEICGFWETCFGAITH